MEGKDNAQTPSEEQEKETTSYATPVVGDYMPLHSSGRSWEISREQVTIIKVIGKGAFSQVAQATVRDMRGKQEDITVAVKMLKGELLVIVVTICYFYYSKVKLSKTRVTSLVWNFENCICLEKWPRKSTEDVSILLNHFNAAFCARP